MNLDIRKYDIVIYGANGSVAKEVIEELKHSGLNIALCTRRNVVKPVYEDFKLLESSIKDIVKITRSTKAILNLVGPYMESAEKILEACIQTQTEYIDICCETEVLKNVFAKFNGDAKKEKIKIIQACGFLSVIADVGAMYISNGFEKCIINSRLKILGTSFSFGVWKSFISSLQEKWKKIEALKQGGRINKKYSIIEDKGFREIGSEKIDCRQRKYRWCSTSKSYDVLFGACDEYVIKKSIRNSEIRYFGYLNIGSLSSLIVYFLMVSIAFLFSKWEATRKLLFRYPQIFSWGTVNRKERKKAELENSSFEIEMLLYGIKETKIEKKLLLVSGPDPVFRTTAICAGECAKLLIENRCDIDGGVYTPAQAFYKFNIIERLKSKGINFSLKD